jgi:uncharacterized protein YecE (DUF72 family)
MRAKAARTVQHTFFDEEKTAHHGPKDPSDPLHWIHFGTSTWAYPGWKNIVYSKVHKNSTDYLREYVEFPSFRTAGADFTFYRPPDPRLLGAWKEFLPKTFRMVFKVWDEITVDRFQKPDQQHSPNRQAGAENPSYLDASLFEDAVLAPFQTSGFTDHVACLLFEFRSATAKNPERFLDGLEAFLPNLPKGFSYAVEIRSPALLGPRYFEILRQSNVSHVFNHWDRMPPLSEQMAGHEFTGPIVVSRILTPLNMRYEDAKKKFAPYNELRPENILPRMRDDVVALALQAISHRLPGYILVNNRSEGCAPLTIRALEEMLQTASGGPLPAVPRIPSRHGVPGT